MLVCRFRLAGPLLAGLLVLLQGPLVLAQSSKLYNPTAFLIQKTYQVGDLFRDGAAKDRLVEYLLRNVEPESWQGQGGEGTIDFFPLGCTLLVRQSPDIQEKIADCLEQFRREMSSTRTGVVEPEEAKTSNPLPATSLAKTSPLPKKLSRLLERYREACKNGDLRKARKLAQQAIELDPTCFGKLWFGERSHERVPGGIE